MSFIGKNNYATIFLLLFKFFIIINKAVEKKICEHILTLSQCQMEDDGKLDQDMVSRINESDEANNIYRRTYDHYQTTDESDNDINRQDKVEIRISKKCKRPSALKSQNFFLNGYSLEGKHHGILKTSESTTPADKRSQSPNDLDTNSSVTKNHRSIEINSSGSNTITLVVDETKFVVDSEMFKQYPNTMLGRMFSTKLENKPNENGEYSVAYGISSTIFKAILDYYKHGVIKCPQNCSIQELKDACDYLLIPFDGNTVRSHDLRGLLNE